MLRSVAVLLFITLCLSSLADAKDRGVRRRRKAILEVDGKDKAERLLTSLWEVDGIKPRDPRDLRSGKHYGTESKSGKGGGMMMGGSKSGEGGGMMMGGSKSGKGGGMMMGGSKSGKGGGMMMGGSKDGKGGKGGGMMGGSKDGKGSSKGGMGMKSMGGKGSSKGGMGMKSKGDDMSFYYF